MNSALTSKNRDLVKVTEKMKTDENKIDVFLESKKPLRLIKEFRVFICKLASNWVKMFEY